jgi:hypothetical protein
MPRRPTKEHPIIRKHLENMCREYGCTVLDLEAVAMEHHIAFAGGSWSKQLRKMIWEYRQAQSAELLSEVLEDQANATKHMAEASECP